MNPNSNSSVAALCTIQCRKGDTFTREFTFTNADTGAPIDLSSHTLLLTVKDSAGTTILTISGADWDLTNAALGEVSCTKSTGTMAAITAGSYAYDLQATVSGNKVTWLQGKFIIDSDISA